MTVGIKNMSIPTGIKTLNIDARLLAILRVAANSFVMMSVEERTAIEKAITSAK